MSRSTDLSEVLRLSSAITKSDREIDFGGPMLERERKGRNSVLEIALCYGLRWTMNWIEVSTRFPECERTAIADPETSALTRLEAEMHEWHARRMWEPLLHVPRETATRASVDILLDDESLDGVAAVTIGPLSAAAAVLSEGGAIVLAWSIPDIRSLSFNRERISIPAARALSQGDRARRMGFLVTGAPECRLRLVPPG